MVTGADPAWAITIPNSYRHELLPPSSVIFSIQRAASPEEAIRGDLKGRFHGNYDGRAVDTVLRDMLHRYSNGSHVAYEIPHDFYDPRTGRELIPHTLPFLIAEEVALAKIIQGADCCMDPETSLRLAGNGLMAYGEIEPDEFRMLWKLGFDGVPAYLRRDLERLDPSNEYPDQKGPVNFFGDFDVNGHMAQQRANEKALEEIRRRLRNEA